MLTQALTIAFLTTSVLGADFYSPVHDFGVMLKRGEAMMKRQGYYPTTHLCGQGETCAEACGPTQVQCPSDAGLYCYDPTVGDHCCPDGTGSKSLAIPKSLFSINPSPVRAYLKTMLTST